MDFTLDEKNYPLPEMRVGFALQVCHCHSTASRTDCPLCSARVLLRALQRFVADLHSRGQRWVPIVDPGTGIPPPSGACALHSCGVTCCFLAAGIKVAPGYPAYDDGITSDAFVRGPDGQPYLGWVSPLKPQCCCRNLCCLLPSPCTTVGEALLSAARRLLCRSGLVPRTSLIS